MSEDIRPILEELESDDPEDAIERAKQYLDEEDPTDDEASQLNYGIAAGLFKLANYRGALERLAQSHDPRRHIFRGFCYLELEEPMEAVGAFDDAAEAEPDRRDEAHLMKAQSFMLADEVDEAQSLYRDLSERDLVEHVEIETHLGLAVSYIETEDYSEARELLESILDDYGEHQYQPEALFYLVEALESLGQVEAAVERAEELQELGEDTMWEEMAGQLLQRLHDQSQDRRSKLRDYEY
jgi:tetratricopeptide (TPR) repeat protein